MKDFRGRDISIGDTVIYPGRSGSHLSVNQGIVHAIQEGQGKPHMWMPLFGMPEDEPAVPYVAARLTVQRQGGSRLSRLERIDRVAVVPE